MSSIYDLLVNKEIYPVTYELSFTQEQSKSLNGAVYIKDLGDPLWKATYQTRKLKPSELNKWRAKFAVMGGSLSRFYAYTTHHYPQAYQKGIGLGDVSNVTVKEISTNRKSITMSGLPQNFIFTTGDFIQLGDDSLHLIVVASDNSFELAPPVPSRTTIGNKVTVTKPCCLMRILPATFKTDADMTGHGSVSFDAVEARL